MSINILILLIISSSIILFMKHFKNDFQSLTQPGRSECGVQLARGFPPRSKWTYREVFHPAVVPQPPFIKCFGFSLNTSLQKAKLTQLNIIYHIVLLHVPIIQLPSYHMTEKKKSFLSLGVPLILQGILQNR